MLPVYICQRKSITMMSHELVSQITSKWTVCSTTCSANEQKNLHYGPFVGGIISRIVSMSRRHHMFVTRYRPLRNDINGRLGKMTIKRFMVNANCHNVISQL